MSIVERLAQLCHPWESAYSHSKVIASAVLAVHLGALLFGGGLAVAADRMTLRSLRGGIAARVQQLDEIHAVHRPVLIALSFLFMSGVLLAAADLKTFAASPFFVVKLSCVALLTMNGVALTLSEGRLRREVAAGSAAPAERSWSMLRATAWLSIALWTMTLCAGVILANSA